MKLQTNFKHVQQTNLLGGMRKLLVKPSMSLSCIRALKAKVNLYLSLFMSNSFILDRITAQLLERATVEPIEPIEQLLAKLRV